MELNQALAATKESSPLEGVSAEAQAASAAEERTVSLAEHRAVKNEARNLRERLRTLEAAEEERKQAERSEVDRLKTQLGAAEAKARTLEVGALRSRAAAKFGLGEDLLPFLTAEDENGALEQAELLAAKLSKPGGVLPPAGNRNPANGGEQAAAAARQEQFEALRAGVPSLRNRVLGF